MRYYLIIGHQLIEKYKEFPTVRVRINGEQVDEFEADNEQEIEISTTMINEIKHHGNGYTRSREQHEAFKFSVPKKFKMIEVDASSWPDEGQLNIELYNNRSDYNNGFMKKRSLVCLSPIYLIRKDIIDNESMIHRIIKKAYMSEWRVKGWDQELATRSTWPGFSIYSRGEKELSMDTTLPDYANVFCKGGNFRINLKITKKHNIYMLGQHNLAVKGYIEVDKFFMAWYNNYKKNHVYLVHTLDTDRENNVGTSKVDIREKLKK